jgi:hypothetical protein
VSEAKRAVKRTKSNPPCAAGCRAAAPSKSGFDLLGRKAAKRQTETQRFIPTSLKIFSTRAPGINALLSGFAWCTTQGHHEDVFIHCK